MNSFEIEVAKREMLYPVCSYPYKVLPITDQGRRSFALYEKGKKRGSAPLESSLKKFFDKYLKKEKPAFEGTASFYYDEESPSRIEEIKQIAMFNMARQNIPGINFKGFGFGYTSGDSPIVEGKDFKIVIGEKIVHEQPKIITWDDIKSL